MTLGELLLSRRRARGLSQADVARLIGVARPQVSVMESGKALLPSWRVRPLAAALGCSVDRLLDAIETSHAEGIER